MLADKHFLIVEDDEYNIRVIDTILKHSHAHTHIARTAEEALDILQHQQFTALLIDLALPGMDGWEFLEQVRQRPDGQDIPCIAITAYHDSRVEREAKEAGFNGYFPKPLDMKTFVEQLTSIL